MLGTYQIRIGTNRRHLTRVHHRNSNSISISTSSISTNSISTNSRGHKTPTTTAAMVEHSQTPPCAAVRHQLLGLSLLRMDRTRGGHSSSVPRARPVDVDISSGKISSTRLLADRLIDSSNRTSHQLPLHLRRMVVDTRSLKSSPNANADYLLRSERRPSRLVTKAGSIMHVLVRS